MKMRWHVVVRGIFHPENAEARLIRITEHNGSHQPFRHCREVAAFFCLQRLPFHLRNVEKNRVVCCLIGNVQWVTNQNLRRLRCLRYHMSSPPPTIFQLAYLLQGISGAAAKPAAFRFVAWSLSLPLVRLAVAARR